MKDNLGCRLSPLYLCGRAIYRFWCDPMTAGRMLLALVRGSIYIVRYSILSRRITIRFPFKAFASVKILGKGHVSIDRNCSVFPSKAQGLTIVTLNPGAWVLIGKRCTFGGTVVRCRTRIQFGSKTMTAYSLIQDTLLVNRPAEPLPRTIPPNPIAVGDNVWLGAHSCILSGCRIGDNCVISAGSAAYNQQIKENCLGIGNPIRRTIPIPAIIRFKAQHA